MNKFLKTMLRKIVPFLVVLLVLSCKTNKIITNGNVDESLSSKKIIKNHYSSQLNYKTISGKMRIDYSDGVSSKGISVSLRMEKDKAIWFSAPLGIVKVYITPDRVSFYNKMENQYFDGNFTYLSNLLGTELDFEKIQNLLLGHAIFDLRTEKYDTTISGDNKYELKPKEVRELFKTLFQIEPQNFKMATQQIAQPWENRLLEIRYKTYQIIDKKVFPNEINIVAIQDDEQTTIEIEYRNIVFNRTMNFPYKIPKGFKEIALK
ncbi:MAG: deoxyuridine 5'-triphosphate nucleotidohydrolase [Flavobacteriaceae bacterium]|nr:MAG: deoxyuridine 5'-triphosphate nucleotidohydrolase [Flavobacteriaceae bacterium]